MIHINQNIIDRLNIIGRILKHTKISVVIVVHQSNTYVNRCLKSLNRQTRKGIEILVISNGINILKKLNAKNLKYIQLNKNYGLSIARNVGVLYSCSKIVAFLDDDALCDKHWIESILESFTNKKIIACRGKIIPLNPKNIFNKFARHYNLGDRLRPSILDTEGNCAIRKDALWRLNGFCPNLFGHEGIELSHRIRTSFKNGLIMYIPHMIVYHDYSHNFVDFFRKKFRYQFNRLKLLAINRIVR